MKYIMFHRGGQLVPIIFPDILQHREVKNALLETLSLSRATPVSAGMCDIYCLSTEGESSTTDLKSLPGDAQIINVWDYYRGAADEPVKAQHVMMVRQAALNILQDPEENAAIDDLFDRSNWPPEKL